MSLQEFESISVIIASWAGIFFAIISLMKKDDNGEKSQKPKSKKYTYLYLFKMVRVYLLTIIFFSLVIYKLISSGTIVGKTDILVISSCVGAIILSLVVCMYKYTLWTAFRSLDDRIA